MVSSCMGAMVMMDKGNVSDEDKGSDGRAKPDNRRRVNRKCRLRRERTGVEDAQKASSAEPPATGAPEL